MQWFEWHKTAPARWHAQLLVAVAVCTCGMVARAETPVGSRYVEPYPIAESKKGLQVEMVGDALALGIKHAAVNVHLSQLVAVGRANDAEGYETWNYQGRTYRFHLGMLRWLDARIKPLSDEGVLVHVILLNSATGRRATDAVMLHPEYDPAAPNKLSALNTVTEDGRRWLAATMEFLAERWSRPDQEHGRVVGYIVGNEVNSHWFWCNRGRCTMQEFADDYLQSVRLVHDAVRRQASWPRVYVSLEHHWGIRYPVGDESQAFPAREFLDYFAHEARESELGDFDWHVAFHPYPENLFEPRFWNDTTAVLSFDTPRVTFKNLEVLCDYLQRDELLWQGEPRRVILSEQGFHTPSGAEGEAVQAAAFCYAYRKVEHLDGVDAFILHRHVDHPHEGGLLLGLRRRSAEDPNDRPKKMIYECFRLADTPEWREAFEFALPIVGLADWDAVQ